MTSGSLKAVFQDQIESLSSPQKRLLIERLRQAGISTPSRGGRLVAFYQAPDELDAEELRAVCTDKLPAHMVPQKFVYQEQIALTANGKLDRNRMRARLWNASNVAVESDMTTARNEVEQTLAEIWCDVLGIDEISVFDNFFEVGGDSLQVIRILSRAAKAGLSIKPDAIFAHPTIAELALRAGQEVEAPQAATAAYGELPLLPIQSWFFDVVSTSQQQWNQSYLFALNVPIEIQQLTQIIGRLLDHHDGLRATFRIEPDGWKSTIAQTLEPAVRTCSLESMSSADRHAEMRAVADEENAAIDLHNGPLFRVVRFTQHNGHGYLGLIAHHLIVDAVSWQVLIGDIQLLLASNASETALSAKQASIKLWAERLKQFACSSDLNEAASYWQEQARHVQVELPDSGDGTKHNPEGKCQWLSRSLEKVHTEVLRTKLPKELRASIQEIILSALVRVLVRWTGREKITIDLEGHGRETLFELVDISQTVGWCTSVFPVTFSGAAADWASHRDALRRVKEQLRAVPHNGLSHGLLNYMSESAEMRQTLSASPRARLLFNYLGREDEKSAPSAPLTLVDPRFGTTRHPDTQRAYVLELNAVIRNDLLVVDWAYCPDIHSQNLIGKLADELMLAVQELVTDEDEGASSVVTPTDFPMAGLDQASLDSLSSQLGDIEDDIDDE